MLASRAVEADPGTDDASDVDGGNEAFVSFDVDLSQPCDPVYALVGILGGACTLMPEPRRHDQQARWDRSQAEASLRAEPEPANVDGLGVRGTGFRSLMTKCASGDNGIWSAS